MSATGKLSIAKDATKIGHHGKTVTAKLGLKVAKSLKGHTLSIDIAATDRDGKRQVEPAARSSASTPTLRPRGGAACAAPAGSPCSSLRLPAAITLTVLFWGSAFVGIRSALPALGYANLASGRLLLAALTFAALSRRFRVPRPSRRSSRCSRARRDRLRRLPTAAFRRRANGPRGHQRAALLRRSRARLCARGTAARRPAQPPRLDRPRDRGRRRGDQRGRPLRPLTGGALVLAAVCVYALWVVLQKRALRGCRRSRSPPGRPGSAPHRAPVRSGLPHAAVTAPAGALITLLLGTVITTIPFLLWTWTMSRLDTTPPRPSFCSSRRPRC